MSYKNISEGIAASCPGGSGIDVKLPLSHRTERLAERSLDGTSGLNCATHTLLGFLSDITRNCDGLLTYKFIVKLALPSALLC